ncbi:MAG: cell envelope biogenesis protein OmpA, partial [Candidatus Binatia bacterium]|nr:cell envelope biogenesis protein OmpA [Candidatus Binatia bacterium]
EGEETVIVALTPNAAYTVGAQNSATVTITDNDIVAPDIIINSGPTVASGGAKNSTTAVFVFTSTDLSATFACSLDGAAFIACTSPKTYTKLKVGAHNFQVRATVNGITDPSPASFDWTVDTKAPNTAITSFPPALTNNPVATFTFTSTETGGGFQCSLDGGAFADCSGGQFVSGALADGKHTFQVKAFDAAGNVDKSAAKARSWTVDTTRPITTITSKPADPTTSPNVSFRFTSEKKSTFQCSLDGGASTSCKSRQKYSGLLPGLHNFQVQATDAAGNVELTPASYSWTQN